MASLDATRSSLSRVTDACPKVDPRFAVRCKVIKLPITACYLPMLASHSQSFLYILELENIAQLFMIFVNHYASNIPLC